jgi:hypothetical protein
VPFAVYYGIGYVLSRRQGRRFGLPNVEDAPEISRRKRLVAVMVAVANVISVFFYIV